MISDFLKPPTDNLYKFMCISGLILVLLSLTFPAWLLNKIAHSHTANKRDLELLQVDSEITNHKSELLTRQADALNKERQFLLQQLESMRGESSTKGSSAISRTQLEYLKNVQDRLEKKDQEWLDKMFAILSTKADERKRLVEIKYKNEAALFDTRSGIFISIAALVTIIMGFWLGIKGFNLWSLRVQVYQDALVKKQAEGSGELGEKD